MKQSSRQIQKVWHILPAEAVLAAWNTSQRGLSVGEVVRRQQVHGLNVLPEKGPTHRPDSFSVKR